jgi:transcriptional regulator with GAF, ATPase, and Fis domain
LNTGSTYLYKVRLPNPLPVLPETCKPYQLKSLPTHKPAMKEWLIIPVGAKEKCPIAVQNLLQHHKSNPFVPLLVFVPDLRDQETLLRQLEQIKCNLPAHKKIVVVTDCICSADKNAFAWQLLQNGVYDIVDGGDEADLLMYIESLLKRNEEIDSILELPMVKKHLVGESRVWKNFLAEVVETALYSSSGILLIGESGTGKELVSRLIHTLDQRPQKKELVLVDCTTIVPGLSGSEFFGHERGAYTNAMQAREGAFALANNGTLFLDEIGELPLLLQAELLRVIQEGTYKKVGSNSWQKTSFRLVCATHRNLQQQIDNGQFRQDLFFRISDFQFKVPSLRDRPSDIPILANHFLQVFFDKKPAPVFDDNVIAYLVQRAYPGNIRELRQVVQRIANRHVSHKKITLGEIPVSDRMLAKEAVRIEDNEMVLELSLKKAILSGASLWDLKNKTMEEAIKAALDITNGNKKMAADKLGVTPRAVQQFLKHKKS